MNLQKFLRVNDSVIVVAEHLQSHNQIGIIIDHYPENSCVIRFPNWNGKGEKQLTIQNKYLKKKGEIDMAALEGRYTVAMVKFVQGANTVKEYAFACFDNTIAVGDTVLCDTQCGYGVAKVTRLVEQEEYSGVAVTKEIICKIDLTEFEKRKANRTLRANLIKKMDKVAKENQNMHLYQMIAESNPEMRMLLEEFNKIGQS